MADYGLRAALYTALTANNALMNDIEGVFDHVPQGTSYPYVTIFLDGIAQELDRAEATITITSWTRSQGHKDVDEIMEQIKQILHNTSLDLSNEATAHIRLTFMETFVGDDRRLHQGVQSFRAQIRFLS